MAAGRVTALSRAVTTVTWMSHGSHGPDTDESRREHAEYHRLCCKTGALPDSEPGPDSDADSDESRWDESLSRAVTTVTWMSHCSHEPDVHESRLEQAGPWYPPECISSKQTLFALSQHAGSPYLCRKLCGTRCGVWNSVAELQNVPHAHLATGQAQAVPIYRPGTQGGL